MLKPVLVTPPTADLLSLIEVKQHCEIELLVPDHDSKLTGFIAAATEVLDGYDGLVGRALINQTWRLNLSSWPDDKLRLPFGPVSAITSIKYYDSDNAQQTLASLNYSSVLEDETSPYVAWLSGVSLPSIYDREDSIEVLFVGGYGATAASVPAGIKLAAKMLIASWMENRETVIVGTNAMEIPWAVDAMIRRFRRVSI